jgi:FkbM family methyltransferase
MKQLIYKAIYNPVINKILRNINKALYPILPEKIKLPPSGIITLSNNRGNKIKMLTNQTNYVTKLLFWEGYKNFEYTNIFIELIKKINVFYDIGANIGYYSLLAETVNPNIEVVAFEPAKGPSYYLKKNIKLNNLKKIKVEEIALSDQNGSINFFEIKNNKYTYLEYNLAGEGNTGSLTVGRNFIPIEVETKTFNQYVIDNNQDNIDLVKIDTEGTEHLILKNADIILEKMKPIIICETLFNKIEIELEEIFKKHGYEFYNHTNEGLEKVNSIQRKTDNGVRNCFFVHPSKAYLINDFVI